jgi:hypothetical protein
MADPPHGKKISAIFPSKEKGFFANWLIIDVESSEGYNRYILTFNIRATAKTMRQMRDACSNVLDFCKSNLSLNAQSRNKNNSGKCIDCCFENNDNIKRITNNEIAREGE